MKLPFRLTHPTLQQLIYSATSLLAGLAFMLIGHPMLAQSGGIYATPGLYTYTVPAGGPYQIKLTAQGGDGGGDGNGGSGARVRGTFTAQSGDIVTLIVGQNGIGKTSNPANGGGGGGSAVVLTHNGAPTLLLAAGGGGGGGFRYGARIQGLGGQGVGTSSAGAGGPTDGNFSGGGGGGGLDGPGGDGQAGFLPGGGGGARASLTAISPGGEAGGNGFGGGGGVGGYDSYPPQASGGGGGGYGGGNGAGRSVNAQGGYSYVSSAGSATTVTPGSAGTSTNRAGLATLLLSNNNATAALTPVNRSICPGSPTTLQGTVSATGSWTLVLSDGTVGTGSGSSFSIPVSPLTSTTYTIASLTDQQGFATDNSLTGQAIITILPNPGPAVSLTNTGGSITTCNGSSSVTLTASGGSSYTFTYGNTVLPGDPTSNTRVVNQAGDYTVRVPGSNGCTYFATTTVLSTAPQPLVTFGNFEGLLSCAVRTNSLIVSEDMSGNRLAITNYTYFKGDSIVERTPGDPNNILTVSSPGLYTVRVTASNSCTGLASVNVGQAVESKPVAYLAYEHDRTLSCTRPTATLIANTGGLGPYEFYQDGVRLTGGYGLLDISTPGVYSVKVTGFNACTNTASLTVTVEQDLVVSLTNNGPISCAQSSATLTASGGSSYTFTYGNTVLPGDPTSNARVVTNPGTYSVVGALNSCTNTASTTVGQAGLTVSYPATTSLVIDQVVNQAFTASEGPSPYSFSVARGSLPPGLSLASTGQLTGSPTQAGSFTAVIQATDANGCSGLGAAYVVNVALFSITSQPPASLSVCTGSPVSVSGGVLGRPTAYQWYKDNAPVAGQTSATLSLASVSSPDAGSYVVVITGGGMSLTSTAVNLTVRSLVPARLYVNASATGANTGLDWANAFTDLQSALNVGAGNPCTNALKEIWVAGGVYKPTATGNRFIAFQLLSGVALYGGFVGNETTLSQRPSVNPTLGGAAHPSSSTLSGDIGQPSNELDNSLGVVYGTNLAPTTVLDGFVITGGRAEANVPIGGGLTNLANSGNSSPTLTNLLFINNYGTSVGGAILNYGLGGAVSPTISNCRFEQNTSGSGGAIATASSSGNSRPVITNCFFAGNSATQWGGAIVNIAEGGTLSPVITNCAFQSNSATQGGAIWQATALTLASVLNTLITNCSFSGNRAEQGGALYNAISIPGSPAGGPIGLTLANSVLFDNGGANTFSNTGDVTLSARYSLLEASVTGYTDGGNNRTTAATPFASSTTLLLGTGSPAINAGDNGAYQTAGGPATDLGGNSRIQQTTIDMGAYESGRQSDCQSGLTVTAGATPLLINVGGVVSLTASASGAAGPLTYQWSAPGSASLTTPATSSAVLARLSTAGVQTFTVVATSGICSQSALVSVTALSGPDLTTIVSLPDANFMARETKGLLLQLQEVNGRAAGGAIVMTITVPTGYSVSFDNTLTSLSVSGGSSNPVTVDNVRWHQSSSVMGLQVSLTINEGQGVGANSTVSLGVRITRTGANSGSVSNITVNVADDAGGSYDVNRLNNVYARIIQAL